MNNRKTKKSSVTIIDIANKLKVSPSTVSRALKGDAQISEKKIIQIQKLAASLNYQPNSLAQNLRSNSTKTIGVIVPDLMLRFFTNTIAGIEEVAYKAGYNVLISQSNETLEREILNIQSNLNNRVAGIIIAISIETKNLEHLKCVLNRNIPLVLFDRDLPELDCSKVLFDDFGGAFKIVEHLIKSGYKRIAHISANNSLSVSINRFKGYKAALKKYNMKYDDDLVIFTGNFTEESGKYATKKLLDLPKPPDAIFAVNDYVALGALKELKQNGIKVPNEIGLAGFCNEPISEVIEPSLTSMGQSGFDIGKTAGKILIDQLNTELKYKNKTEIITDFLHVRASSQPIKKRK